MLYAGKRPSRMFPAVRIRHQNRFSSPHEHHSPRLRSRFDAACVTILAVALLLFLGGLVPRAEAGNDSAGDTPKPNYNLPKSFIGNLPITQLTQDEAILHALNRLAYGPRPGDVERIRAMGLEKWITQQLNFDSIDDSALNARLSGFETLHMSSAKLLEKYPPPNQVAKKEGITPEEYRAQMQQKMQKQRQELNEEGVDPAVIQLETMPGPQRIQMELDIATLDRAIYDNRQLFEVMANFWFNHFNVNVNKGADRWLVTSYVENTIRPHAMGKFEDLVLATAKSPAMLFYLDNWLSADPVAFQQMQAELAMRRRRFEGFFMGMTPPAPRQFPQPQNSANGQPANGQPGNVPPRKQERGLNENYGREIMELHTLGVNGGYTQQDVIAVAKCLTGWTIRAPQKDAQFFFDDRIHDQSVKYVMGQRIDFGGMKDGEAVIHMLSTSEATAHHITLELAEHFVSDDPPPALVNRMAQTFLSSGGDTRAVLRTMIYSPEFWSRDAYRAKIKTPFELTVSATRALGVDATVPVQLAQWVGRMGEPMYQCEPPTGYADTATVWVNAGSLLNRLNFALTLATNHIAGISTDLTTLFGEDAAANPNVALNRALSDFLDGEVSDSTRATLVKQLSDPQILQARLDDPVKHVNEGLIAGMVLGAPEFQRR
ncbi:MAG TPA: DUF1800 domain-containing protein [Candidatus Acidoferrales bacterium]|nr:DUF1800 domain-containing protein [Candidatus Acidoferrales bacterium]